MALLGEGVLEETSNLATSTMSYDNLDLKHTDEDDEHLDDLEDAAAPPDAPTEVSRPVTATEDVESKDKPIEEYLPIEPAATSVVDTTKDAHHLEEPASLSFEQPNLATTTENIGPKEKPSEETFSISSSAESIELRHDITEPAHTPAEQSTSTVEHRFLDSELAKTMLPETQVSHKTNTELNETAEHLAAENEKNQGILKQANSETLQALAHCKEALEKNKEYQAQISILQEDRSTFMAEIEKLNEYNVAFSKGLQGQVERGDELERRFGVESLKFQNALKEQIKKGLKQRKAYGAEIDSLRNACQAGAEKFLQIKKHTAELQSQVETLQKAREEDGESRALLEREVERLGEINTAKGMEIEEYAKQVEDLTHKLKSLTTQGKALQSRVISLEQAREENSRALELREKQIEDLNAANNSKDIEIKDYKRQVKDLDVKVQSLAKTNMAKDAEVTALRKDYRALSDTSQLKDIELEKSAAREQDLATRVRALNEEAEDLRKERQQDIEDLEREMKVLQDQLATAEEDGKHQADMVEEFRQKNERIMTELAEMEIEKDKQTTKVINIIAEKEELESDLSETQLQTESHAALVQQISSEKEALAAEIARLKREINGRSGALYNIKTVLPASARALKGVAVNAMHRVTSYKSPTLGPRLASVWKLILIFWLLSLNVMHDHHLQHSPSPSVPLVYESTVPLAPGMCALRGNETLSIYEQVCAAPFFPRSSAEENIWSGLEDADFDDEFDPEFNTNPESPNSSRMSYLLSILNEAAPTDVTEWVVLLAIHTQPRRWSGRRH
ncbi:uncharacterized protein PAC_17039 [Phialocephala subalpina]|uniref:Uncharacterized protein n=1 Tax=Phialocephala subalpina TaxID=576137 RepID=A0A1L7XQ29_9HELO|nr:uncharacterized protein PAC_17039 [Phialocephala subalpina]